MVHYPVQPRRRREKPDEPPADAAPPPVSLLQNYFGPNYMRRSVLRPSTPAKHPTPEQPAAEQPVVVPMRRSVLRPPVEQPVVQPVVEPVAEQPVVVPVPEEVEIVAEDQPEEDQPADQNTENQDPSGAQSMTKSQRKRLNKKTRSNNLQEATAMTELENAQIKQDFEAMKIALALADHEKLALKVQLRKTEETLAKYTKTTDAALEHKNEALQENILFQQSANGDLAAWRVKTESQIATFRKTMEGRMEALREANLSAARRIVRLMQENAKLKRELYRKHLSVGMRLTLAGLEEQRKSIAETMVRVKARMEKAKGENQMILTLLTQYLGELEVPLRAIEANIEMIQSKVTVTREQLVPIPSLPTPLELAEES